MSEITVSLECNGRSRVRTFPNAEEASYYVEAYMIWHPSATIIRLP